MIVCYLNVIGIAVDQSKGEADRVRSQRPVAQSLNQEIMLKRSRTEDIRVGLLPRNLGVEEDIQKGPSMLTGPL